MKRSRITKHMITETAHRLWNHPGACRNIHGHSYKFEVTIEGDIDLETGMICDFKLLKAMMDTIIGKWDHSLILHSEDPYLSIFRQLNILIFVVDWMPTAENMAADIAAQMSTTLSELGEQLRNVCPMVHTKVVNVTVWETSTSCAQWNISGV